MYLGYQCSHGNPNYRAYGRVYVHMQSHSTRPSQIYSADRLRNWLRHRFTSGSVLDKQPCLSSESCWNDDIIVEILSRLPVNSLLRFRSVCKSWRALISHSYFVNKHLDHAINGILGSTTYSTNCSMRLLFLNNMHFLDEYHPQSMLVNSLKEFVGHTTSKELDVPGVLEVIVGSCNGLICLKAVCDGVFLWNPSTGEASKLPNQTFNADWSNMIYGFGYDSTAEDYKVILGGATTKKIEVFALKGSWRNVASLKDYTISGQGCLSNGNLHWVEKGYDYLNRYSSASRIISFDLQKENFMEMGRLSFLSDKKYTNIGIGSTIRDSLYVYCAHEVITDPILFTIWMMKEYGVMESWTREQIHRNSLPRSPELRDVLYNEPIIILQNGEILMTWKSENKSSFILYDPHKKKSRIASRIRVCVSHHQAMYIESLVSPITGGATVDI